MTEELYNILTRPKQLREQIGVLDAKIDACLTGLLPGGIRYDIPRVQTSPKEQFPEVMAKVDDLTSKRIERARELFESIEQINSLANTIQDSTQKAVVIMHYIGGMTLTEVGERLGYTKSGVWHIHNKGIEFLEKETNETKETAKM